MQSGLIFLASIGVISGTGFAIAKITGSGASFLKIYSSKTPAFDSPINTSAPSHTSLKLRNFVFAGYANSCLNSFIPYLRPSKTKPFVSTKKMFYFDAPFDSISFKQAIPAAPAPFTTIFKSFNYLPVILHVFMSPARTTIAVPC